MAFIVLQRQRAVVSSVSKLVRNIQSATTSSTAPIECYIEKLEMHPGISILNFNRPSAKNALGRNLMSQFTASLKQLRFDPSVRVVIVRSLADKAFCSGADLKERKTMKEQEVAEFVHGLRAAFTDLETLAIPTISVIDGAAMGGGLELALATDMRVAGSGAKIGLPETKLAIIPGAGGTQRLPRLIGAAKAKELIFTGRILNNIQAADIGIVNYAVEGSGYDKALELAKEILPQGPVAIRMAKLAVDKGIQLDLSSGMAFEQTCYAQVIPTADRIEGLAAFSEKRTPIYKGK